MANGTAQKRADVEMMAEQSLAGVRILAIMPSIPLQGMERANLQILQLLRARGAEVLIIVEKNFGAAVAREAERLGCRTAPASILGCYEERLHLSRSPREMFQVLRAWFRAASEIKLIHQEFRPTHVYLTNIAYFLYALPTLRRSREPVFFRLPNPPAAGLTPWKQRVSDGLWRYAIAPLCDLMICNCEYTRARVKNICGDRARIEVIHNCLPGRATATVSDAPRLDQRRFNIAYLGRIRPEKGVGQLFQAALRCVGELNNVDFYFAGEYAWKNPFAEALIEQVRSLHLHERIHFTGELDDVFGLLRQCHLHVCPSVSAGESFPNVLLEAKASAIPSVVFPTAGIPEGIQHKIDGYVCGEKTADALYAGIKYFLDNPQLRQSAGRAAAASLARFSRERAADRWTALFRCREDTSHVA